MHNPAGKGEWKRNTAELFPTIKTITHREPLFIRYQLWEPIKLTCCSPVKKHLIVTEQMNN